MTKSTKWLLATATLLMVSHPAYAPWRVGNGGDALRLAFAKAKEHASAVTAKINEAALASARPDVKRWLVANKDRLAAAILGAKHIWTTDEKPTCAWVSHGGDSGDDPTAVYLSYPTCGRTVDDYRAAGELLVHESVHHLGLGDESFADAVALAIYDAVDAGLTVWQPIARAPGPRQGATSVWTGEKMLTFGGADDRGQVTSDLWSFHPETNRWEVLLTDGIEGRYLAQSVWTDDKLVVWGGFDSRGDWLNSGAIFDPQTRRWKGIHPEDAPERLAISDIRGPAQTLVWTGKEALVWGGSIARSHSTGQIPGYRIDPASGRVSSFSGPDAVHRMQGHTAVWADGEMIVWGGLDEGGFYTATGGRYDPDTGRWTLIDGRGAPKARYGHTAVWTGSEMVVFGHYGSTFTGDGGVYDPATGRWKLFTSETVMSRIHHTAVWTGREMLIFGGRYRGTRLSSVAGFDPKTLKFRTVELTGALEGRGQHTAVWTGAGMIVVGGTTGRPESDGGIFLP